MGRLTINRFYVTVIPFFKHFLDLTLPDNPVFHQTENAQRINTYGRRNFWISTRLAIVPLQHPILAYKGPASLWPKQAILHLRKFDNWIAMHSEMRSLDELSEAVPYGAISKEFVDYAKELSLPFIHRTLAKALDKRLSLGMQP